MAAARLMNENTSLFSNAELQIQLRTPATPVAAASALHETPVAYTPTPPKKRSKLKPGTALTRNRE